METKVKDFREKIESEKDNLRGVNLSGADLRGVNLSGAVLTKANLEKADLSGADLSGADLWRANLTNSLLKDVTARNANFHECDFSHSLCQRMNFQNACLNEAIFINASLYGANLTDADLSSTDLRGTDLSGVKGLMSPSEWMEKNFEKSKNGYGYIVYKMFNVIHNKPSYWKVEEGSVIKEEVNPLRSDSGSGINFGTREWIINFIRNTEMRHSEPTVWKCLIKWEWLPDVVVPYNTSGNARCGKLQIIQKADKEIYKEVWNL